MLNQSSYSCNSLFLDYNWNKVFFNQLNIGGKHIIKKKCWNIIIGISEIKIFANKWNQFEPVLLPIL